VYRLPADAQTDSTSAQAATTTATTKEALI
jgi:hypothetical protein